MKRPVIWLSVFILLVCACSPTDSEPLGSTKQEVVFTGSTSGQSQYAGTCASTGTAPEKVFQWVAPRSGTATFTTCGGTTNFDTVLYARKNTINGSQLFCNDDASPACGSDASKATASVVACTTYFVFVDGWSGSQGNFTLTITPPAGTPAVCADAGGSDAVQDAVADGGDGAADSSEGSDAGLSGREDSSGADVQTIQDSGGGGDVFSSRSGDSGGDEDGGAALSDASDGGFGDSGDSGGALTVYPLIKLPNVRYLVDQQSRPFLIQGEAAWSIIAQLVDSEQETYLANRQAKGFNTIIVNLLEHFYSSHPPADAYGDQPFTTPGDFSTPNEAYFSRADAVLRRAASHGIQVLLFPLYLGNAGDNEGWYQEMIANGTTKLTNYGTYVGNRYRNFDNVIWVIGGDYSPPDTGLINAFANAIQAADGRHLMTFHGSSFTDSAMNNYGGQPWLTLNSVYTYQTNGAVGGVVLGEYNRSNWLPVFLIESSYENELASVQDVRRQAYESILNGGMGQVFGNSPIWCFSTTGPCIYSGPTDWHTQLDGQGSRDQMRLGSLFSARHWEKLVPDSGHRCLAAGFSGTSTEMASDNSWCAAFLPSSRQVTVGLGNFAPRMLSLSWFNPSTGSFTTVSGSPFANSGSVTISPPGAGDWVLVVE